jgi:hypothetical protein
VIILEYFGFFDKIGLDWLLKKYLTKDRNALLRYFNFSGSSKKNVLFSSGNRE